MNDSDDRPVRRGPKKDRNLVLDWEYRILFGKDWRRGLGIRSDKQRKYRG